MKTQRHGSITKKTPEHQVIEACKHVGTKPKNNKAKKTPRHRKKRKEELRLDGELTERKNEKRQRRRGRLIPALLKNKGYRAKQ